MKPAWGRLPPTNVYERARFTWTINALPFLVTCGVSSALSRRFADYTTEWIPGPMGVYRYLCSETSPKETYRELRVSPATIRQCIPGPPVFPLLHKPPRSPRISCPRNTPASVRPDGRWMHGSSATASQGRTMHTSSQIVEFMGCNARMRFTCAGLSSYHSEV